jgi:hypothetical protein
MNPTRTEARSIEWEPSADADIHHGARDNSRRQTPNTWPQPTSRQKLKKTLATQEPTIHGGLGLMRRQQLRKAV